jgi:hypothetical protein
VIVFMSTLIFEPVANVPSGLSVKLPCAPAIVMMASFGAGTRELDLAPIPSRSLLATPAGFQLRVRRSGRLCADARSRGWRFVVARALRRRGLGEPLCRTRSEGAVRAQRLD